MLLTWYSDLFQTEIPVLEEKWIIHWQKYCLTLPLHMVKANKNLAPMSELLFPLVLELEQ